MPRLRVRMKRTKASKLALFMVSDIRCLEFIHLTGWHFKGLAMDRTLIDWVNLNRNHKATILSLPFFAF